MHKIKTKTSVDGEFVPGNPSTGQQATKLNADWFNTVQRELVNVVTDAGIVLSDTDDTQVARAISILAIAAALNGSHETNGFKIVDRSGNSTNMSPSGFGADFTRAGVSFSVDNEGLHVSVNDSDGNDVDIDIGSQIDVGDDVHITRGTSQFNILNVLGKLVVYGNVFLSGLNITDSLLKITKETLFKNSVSIGSEGHKVEIDVDGNVTADKEVKGLIITSRKNMIAGTTFGGKIYDADSSSNLLNPSTILATVANVGAVAMVRNNTGSAVSITRTVPGSTDHSYVVVNSGEILMYVYNGSSWVHAW